MSCVPVFCRLTGRRGGRWSVVGGRWCTIVLRPLGGPRGLPTIGLSHHRHCCHRRDRHHNQCHVHHCHHHHHRHSTPRGVGGRGVPRIRVSHVFRVEESNFTITRESENFCFQQRYTLSAYALGKGPRYYGSQMQTKDIKRQAKKINE